MKITNKGINFTVNTVEELLTLSGEENQVVVVSDENRGGTFIYRSAKATTNDGGVTFNGWCRQYSGAVNVKWFGQNIQKTIDSRNSFEFDKGIILINSNITLPQTPQNNGFVMSGKGYCVTDPIESSYRYMSATLLKVNSIITGSLFDFKDTLGVVINDLSVHGNYMVDTLFHYRSQYAGSGVSTFKNVSFFGANESAVKCGTSSTDGTCADIYFNQVTFKSCKYGLHVLNAQGLNYNFNQLSANSCDSVVRLTEGGALHLYDVNFANCGNDLVGDYCIHIENAGDNTFGNVINGIRFEQNCKNMFYGGNYGTTVIDSLVESQTSSNTNKIKLYGHTLIVKNSYFSSFNNLVNMSSRAGRAPKIVFENCFFNSIKTFEDLKDMFKLDSNSMMSISIINSTVNDGTSKQQKIKNFYSNSLDGPVVHSASITGSSTPKYLYLFNETAVNYYNSIKLNKNISLIEAVIVSVDNTTGEIHTCDVKAKVKYDGVALTIMSHELTNKTSSGSLVFNTAVFEVSVIGARLKVTNPSGGVNTWTHTATISVTQLK